MMLYLSSAIEVIHVCFAALWFGAQVVSSYDIANIERYTEEYYHYIKKRFEHLNLISLIAGLLTVLTGSIIALMHGGFEVLPPRIMLGFMLTMVLLLVDGRLLRPAAQDVAYCLGLVTNTDKNMFKNKRNKTQFDAVALSKHRKKYSFYLSITIILWVAVTMTMILE